MLIYVKIPNIGADNQPDRSIPSAQYQSIEMQALMLCKKSGITHFFKGFFDDVHND